MSGAKEIRTKIGSIKNTQKITSAMEMVAASKMRKAQDRMTASKPYATHIRGVVNHLAQGHSEYHHNYLDDREVKRVGYIMVSSDRGLCGGLNNNMFKKALDSMKKQSDQGIEIDLCLIGSKAINFFKSYGGNVKSTASHLGDTPTTSQLIGAVKVMLDSYDQEQIDRLYLVNNEFINTMTQSPQVKQIVPLPIDNEEEELSHYWDYIYEPDAKELLDVMLVRYIESQVYQAVIENLACEMAARMVAMKSATDNAGDLIDELELVYNKARQAAITQELSEIVAGAAAV